MAQVLPLTPGLLISMSIRNDHGFGLGDLSNFGFARQNPRPLHESQIETINVSYDEYIAAYNGEYCQGQRLEECTGTGFYHPEKEAGYVGSADPIALKHAQALCEQFEKLVALTPCRPSQA